MSRWLDRCARVGMVAGVGLMLQPFWGTGLKYGYLFLSRLLARCCTL